MKTRFKLTAISLSLILILGLAAPLTALAQTASGTILGTVSDSNGGVITDATVKITNVQTGFSRTVTTDSEGRYRVPVLPLGKYEVRAEHAGFATKVHTEIELTVGREAVVDFTLTAGRVEESVLVVGEASLVETTNPSLSGYVGTRRVNELPLNGRDVFQLATLQVGVVSTAALDTGDTIDIGPGATKIAVNGARITANSFLLDGTFLNDAFNNTPGAVSGAFS